jgi:hypothetical protein
MRLSVATPLGERLTPSGARGSPSQIALLMPPLPRRAQGVQYEHRIVGGAGDLLHVVHYDHVLAAQLDQQPLDLEHGDRVERQAGLVQQHLGARHDRAGAALALLLAARSPGGHAAPPILTCSCIFNA